MRSPDCDKQLRGLFMSEMKCGLKSLVLVKTREDVSKNNGSAEDSVGVKETIHFQL